MNNEIKEILEALKPQDKEFVEAGSKEFPLQLTPKEQKILLDYITNLQEENERLKELCDKYEEEHKTTFKIWKKDLKNFEHEKNRELKARIEKAIEYIGNGNLGIPRKTRDKFIKILKGKDNE